MILADAVLALRANRYSGKGLWLDESDSGLDATISANTRFDGKVFSFGVTDNVMISQAAIASVLTIGVAESLTVLARVFPTNEAASTGIVDNKIYSVDNGGFTVYRSTPGFTQGGIGDAGGVNVAEGSGAACPAYQWTSVALRLDKRASISMWTDRGGVGWSGQQPGLVGEIPVERDLTICSQNFSGKLAGVGIWKAHLTVEELHRASIELTLSEEVPSIPEIGRHELIGATA